MAGPTAGRWEDYAAAAPAGQAGPWQDYAQPAAKLGAPPVTREMVNASPSVSGVASAFMRGAQEGAGPDPLGFSQESMNWLIGHGIFRKDDKLDSPKAVFQAFNEAVFYPAAAALDAAARVPSALFRGLQAAGVAAGLPRDVVAMPEAFLGSPGAFHVEQPLSPPKEFVESTPIQPIEGAPTIARSQAALTGDPVVDAVIQHPTIRGVIDNAVIDRQHAIPYEAGGSLPVDNPTTYVDKHVPQQFTVKRLSDPSQSVTFDTGEPMAIHENVEEFVMETLIKNGWKPKEAYRAAHFGFAEPAEHAWYRANDIDPDAAEAEWKKLQPGIQHEIATDSPPDLYHKEYPGEDVTLARHEQLFEQPATPDELARARDVMAQALASDRPSAAEVAQTARDLGVIGPGKPTGEGLPPAEAAEALVPNRAVAASQSRGDVLRGPEPSGGAGMDPWQQRFGTFVGNLRAGDDVKQLIRDAAKENGDFLPARQGEIPLAQVEDIERAAGVEPGSTDRRGLGRLLKNDSEVRVAMQTMLQATENVRDAARDVKADGGPESLMKLQEAMMRRDLAVEQIVGLRAEWGRTGKVFQEFLDNVKDAEAFGDWLKQNGKGRTPADLRDIADMVDALDGAGAARFLTAARQPNFWDKYLFYWVNALISGPVTHVKYIGANAAFAGYEAGLVTPIAGVLGTARRARLGQDGEGVFMGEAAARLYGLLAGTPDALKAAWRAARENIQTPLPGEAAKGENPVINMKPNPIGGLAGTVIGIPSRGASGIHSFFNFLGYRAELEAQAYRAAAKEGLSPFGDDFWQRRQQLVDNPTDAAIDKAIENGYKLTFIQEQGKFGKALAKFANSRFGPGDTQPLKLILPFTHIPGNILRGALEQTPAAFLDERMRADLLGKNGAAAQDMATARIIAGSAVSAMVVNFALNDNITGFGPTDEKERAIWLRTHEPYSVRLNGWWVSYNKFGPIGDLAGLVANLVDVGPKVREEEYSEAAGRIVKATSRLLEDEVGMQGVVNLIEALEDPDRKIGRFLSSQAASNLPYSSTLRQTASFTDPYMREARTFVDQLRYSVPYGRQALLPRRDWLGAPLANPGFASILRARAVNADPIDREITALQIKPAPPEDRIGGVKLTPGLYDQYQALAGALTRTALESLVAMPGWASLPPFVREQAIHRFIDGARGYARGAMQARYPQLIDAGIQQRLEQISGRSPSARPKRAPESIQTLQ